MFFKSVYMHTRVALPGLVNVGFLMCYDLKTQVPGAELEGICETIFLIKIFLKLFI